MINTIKICFRWRFDSNERKSRRTESSAEENSRIIHTCSNRGIGKNVFSSEVRKCFMEMHNLNRIKMSELYYDPTFFSIFKVFERR